MLWSICFVSLCLQFWKLWIFPSLLFTLSRPNLGVSCFSFFIFFWASRWYCVLRDSPFYSFMETFLSFKLSITGLWRILLEMGHIVIHTLSKCMKWKEVGCIDYITLPEKVLKRWERMAVQCVVVIDNGYEPGVVIEVSSSRKKLASSFFARFPRSLRLWR